ncbi:transthyretin-like family protein [Aureispira anguillae]|uniref:Transthyretin-like family protein n=1 Tax=Aureispira anguillae TaxID=2864201 RepID=A0A916DRE1_9BACT|nr:transthyretin-like family protein [Aureispira anguillae]BDS11226.1 transthyretin-like family protein [Aureispira anguillae]
MSNAITISGSTYTVTGTVKNKADNKGIIDLHVLVYDKDSIGEDDFLGIGVTDATGAFSVSFDASKFRFLYVFDRSPDLYFVVNDAGLELLNTEDNVIKNANESTPPINLEVGLLNDKLRKLINEVPVEGWKGGFSTSNPDFAYPTPNLTSLEMLDNLANIPKLQRQQKVVWPEFSWESEPGKNDPKRCYQMFAPDISRLGYTDEGRVYSIICPQQGFCSPNLGSMNVEVTVTGNRGWANESDRELAADMSVVGKIWFSPSAHENKFVKEFMEDFNKNKLPFPSTKENAIVVRTFNPGQPEQIIFPLMKGSSKDFPIPNFAKHTGIAWTLGHLGVEIGAIEKTGVEKVDKFNQFVMDIFNIASGNMLKEGNVLTWNVWFTAPELVDQEEWADHAEKWRQSINADHGSPEGPGTIARYFDGTPFSPLKELLEDELPKILSFRKEALELV